MGHGPDDALSAEEFFALVETLLAPPMAALGYHPIHGSVNDQPASRTELTTAGEGCGGPPLTRFEYGFEAGSDEVRQLLRPEDPETEDEWWVHYEPSTGRLELHDSRLVAEYDIWRDDGPCSAAEVERRLAALGQAVLTFVREHGGSPRAH